MNMSSTKHELQSVLHTVYAAKWHMNCFWWIVWIAKRNLNVKSGKCLVVAFALWCMGFYCSSSDAAVNYSPFYWTASDSAGFFGRICTSRVFQGKRSLQNLKCKEWCFTKTMEELPNRLFCEINFFESQSLMMVTAKYGANNKQRNPIGHHNLGSFEWALSCHCLVSISAKIHIRANNTAITVHTVPITLLVLTLQITLQLLHVRTPIDFYTLTANNALKDNTAIMHW